MPYPCSSIFLKIIYVLVHFRAFYNAHIEHVFQFRLYIAIASVAQWIRHRPPKPGIAGSSPAGGSSFSATRQGLVRQHIIIHVIVAIVVV